MRRIGRVLLSVALCIVVILSFQRCLQNKKALIRHKTTSVVALDQAVTFTKDSCRAYKWEDPAEAIDGNAASFTLFREEQGKVTNEMLSRTVAMEVVQLAGASELLFPDANPLALGDTSGCLISVRAAYKLFGSEQVIGNKLRLCGKDYEIRGLIREDLDLFLYEAADTDGALFDQVAVRSNGVLSSQEAIQYIQNHFNLFGTVSKFYWKGLPDFGTSIERIKEDTQYLLFKKCNCLEEVYLIYQWNFWKWGILFVITGIFSVRIIVKWYKRQFK